MRPQTANGMITCAPYLYRRLSSGIRFHVLHCLHLDDRSCRRTTRPEVLKGFRMFGLHVFGHLVVIRLD
jgi:hypothetical protein